MRALFLVPRRANNASALTRELRSQLPVCVSRWFPQTSNVDMARVFVRTDGSLNGVLRLIDGAHRDRRY